MKDYDKFIIDSYAFDATSGKLSLRYSLDDEVKFEETFTFPVSKKNYDAATLDRALFGLHLMCGISYFKSCLPKEIVVRSGKLTKEQAEFWNIVYTKGLGEFFYENDIDFRDLIHFPANATTDPLIPEVQLRSSSVLVPFGGGKDSFVTAEMKKEEGKDVTLLRVGAHPFITEAIAATGLPSLTIDRKISPELIKLNSDGALNGHIPITAIVSWVAVVAAILHDFGEIAMSNEQSASEGNAMLHGMEVNHQWSKSEEFEFMLAMYLNVYIAKNVLYRSALRSLTEFDIAERFTAMRKYLPLAVSCNANWSLTKGPASKRWCCICPKCAFVFAMYAAFLSKEDVIKIFGENLFDKEALVPIYRELLGISGIKPFECVGTPEETRKAFALISETGDFAGSLAMRVYDRM